MALDGKKKSGAALLIGLGLGKPKMMPENEASGSEDGLDEDEAGEYAPTEDELAAGDDVLAAVAAKDGEALAKALCNLMDLHKLAEDKEQIDEEESE